MTGAEERDYCFDFLPRTKVCAIQEGCGLEREIFCEFEVGFVIPCFSGYAEGPLPRVVMTWNGGLLPSTESLVEGLPLMWIDVELGKPGYSELWLFRVIYVVIYKLLFFFFLRETPTRYALDVVENTVLRLKPPPLRRPHVTDPNAMLHLD